MSEKTLATLHARLAPLAVTTSPLAVPPPRETRFGSGLALSRVHWLRPVLVAEITYLTWADDGLLRHTVFVGLRDDKPPARGAASTAGLIAEQNSANASVHAIVSMCPSERPFAGGKFLSHFLVSCSRGFDVP